MSLDKNIQGEYQRLNKQYKSTPQYKRLEKIFIGLERAFGDLKACKAIEHHTSKKDACYTLLYLDYPSNYVSQLTGEPLHRVNAYQAHITMKTRGWGEDEEDEEKIDEKLRDEILKEIKYRTRTGNVARIENGKVIKMSEDLVEKYKKYGVRKMVIMGIQAAYFKKHKRLKKKKNRMIGQFEAQSRELRAENGKVY